MSKFARRFLKWIASIFLVLAAVILLVDLYFYYWKSLYIVTVENHSSATLTNVQVALTHNLIWTGKLPPGARHTSFGFPDNEGAAHVSFDAGSKHANWRFGYIGMDLGTTFTVVVMPSLKPDVREPETSLRVDELPDDGPAWP